MFDILFTLSFSTAEQINLILLIFITLLEFIAFGWLIVQMRKSGRERDKIIKLEERQIAMERRILKTLESKRLIKRSPNPEDGRGVLINLTTLGLEKREDSRQRVFMFNNKIKTEIGLEKLNHFFDVSETILQLIHEKKIF